jgi:FAD:protein FMN transferase
MRFTRNQSWHRRSAEPVLGTRLSVQVRCAQQRVADAVTTQLQTEIERLENIFSVYRPQSTLNEFKNAPTPSTLRFTAHPELCEVLALAEHWRQSTGGCFNPLADEFTHRWRNAEANQLVPTADELDSLRRSIADPCYRISETGDVTKTGGCSFLSLHAIAKGWIVDRAAELAMADERVSAVLVNIGGDLRLCGPAAFATSPIAIENPLRAYDNESPLCTIQLSGGGLATSGGSRRGFTIAESWYSHVIDPRTGTPVDQVASASVFAPNAATADAISTMLSVVEPAEGLAFVASLVTQGLFSEEALGCLIIDKAGRLFSNSAWDALIVQPSA